MTLVPILRSMAAVCLGLLLIAPLAAAERQLPGRVLRVIDGDSLVLDVRGSEYRVEIAGIDAPEANQPWGDRATQRLQDLLSGAFVVVDATADSAGTQLSGRLLFKDRDVALDLLHDGLAWTTETPPESELQMAHPYVLAESRARRQRRGLWSDPQPLPPWQWRNFRAR